MKQVATKIERIAVVVGMVLLAGWGLAGCEANNTADIQQTEKQEKTLLEANSQVGLPNIKNFTELRQIKRIYELRDDAKLPTFTYLVGLDGTPKFLFRSLGYGIPYSAQASNPEKTAWTAGGTFYTAPQAEPNGLFMPDSSDGTWIIAVSPEGKEEVVYMEPRIIVSPFRLNSTGKE